MVLVGRDVRTRHTSPLRIIEGHAEEVGAWILERLPEVRELPGGYEAIGIARDTGLVGGLLYTSWIPCKGGGDVRMWAAGDPGWLSRRVIAVMFHYPFVQLDCHRMTLLIARDNRTSRSISEQLGFRLEGVLREGLAPGLDLMIYGMLRTELRWSLKHAQAR
jgi:RimJ/RimL family protein N-acetyltransferase